MKNLCIFPFFYYKKTITGKKIQRSSYLRQLNNTLEVSLIAGSDEF